jgi:hypothetical protein
VGSPRQKQGIRVNHPRSLPALSPPQGSRRLPARTMREHAAPVWATHHTLGGLVAKTPPPGRSPTLPVQAVLVEAVSNRFRVDDRSGQASLVTNLAAHCLCCATISHGPAFRNNPAPCLARRAKRQPDSTGSVNRKRHRAVLATSRSGRFRHTSSDCCVSVVVCLSTQASYCATGIKGVDSNPSDDPRGILLGSITLQPRRCL